MQLLISPAKTLDFESPSPPVSATAPEFLEHAEELVVELRHILSAQLASLLNISDKLAKLNWERFQNWAPEASLAGSRHALFAFRGDVYTHLEADTLNEAQLDYAQQHLLILSGLYGLLRPLDAIYPYRLEMGTRLLNSRGSNLYAFWGDRLALAVSRRLAECGGPLVNLASLEYFKAVNRKSLSGRVVTPQFKEYRKGAYRVISFCAKRARGMMSSFAIRNRIEDAEQLKDFDGGGYSYRSNLSSADEWVFARDSERA